MKIGKYNDDKWVNKIRAIKHEITRDVCLSLLGDFNWRTRLVGAYFSAVKGYSDHTSIIGTHLLKSELCCVGHIYTLTLSYFNDETSINFLNRYLEYYLTKPELYFDQESAMEALLYLDRINNTNHFQKHMDNWNTMQTERKKNEKLRSESIIEMLRMAENSNFTNDQLSELQKITPTPPYQFKTDYLDRQILILKELSFETE